MMAAHAFSPAQSLRLAPPNFDDKFIELGRLGCEGYFHEGRLTIDAWLRERGKKRLIEARAEFVQRKEGARLNRRDVGKLLREAYREPIRDRRKVPLALARAAAQHLRIKRYGGWIVSQCPNGDWRVGTKRVSAAQLVDMAKAVGFSPSLTGGE